MTRAAWKRWSEEETQALRRLALTKSAEEAAEALGRTVQQVRGYASRQSIRFSARLAAEKAAYARWDEPLARFGDAKLLTIVAYAETHGLPEACAKFKLKDGERPALARLLEESL